MNSSKPLVYVVVETRNGEDFRVKAVFESEGAAQEAINEEFSEMFDYEVVPRTLYESINE